MNILIWHAIQSACDCLWRTESRQQKERPNYPQLLTWQTRISSLKGQSVDPVRSIQSAMNLKGEGGHNEKRCGLRGRSDMDWHESLCFSTAWITSYSSLRETKCCFIAFLLISDSWLCLFNTWSFILSGCSHCAVTISIPLFEPSPNEGASACIVWSRLYLPQMSQLLWINVD